MRNLYLFLCALVLTGGLVAGCDSGGSDDFIAANPGGNTNINTPQANVEFRFVLARAVPAAVGSIRLTGFTASQTATYGPTSFQKATTITITVPITTSSVMGEYLDNNNQVVGTFVAPTSNLVAGETRQINDPDFIDADTPGQGGPVLNLGVEGKDQDSQSVALSDDGLLLIVYPQNDSDEEFIGETFEMLYRSFNTGNFTALPTAGSSGTLSSVLGVPEVALARNGDFVATWLESPSILTTLGSLHGQRFTRSGTSFSPAGSAVTLAEVISKSGDKMDIPADDSAVRTAYSLDENDSSSGGQMPVAQNFNSTTLAALTGRTDIALPAANSASVKDVSATPDGDYTFVTSTANVGPEDNDLLVVVLDRSGQLVAGPVDITDEVDNFFTDINTGVFAKDAQGNYHGVTVYKPSFKATLAACTYTFNPTSGLSVDQRSVLLNSGGSVANVLGARDTMSVIPGTNRFVMAWIYDEDPEYHVRLRSFDGLTLTPHSDLFEVSNDGSDPDESFSNFDAGAYPDRAGNVAVVWGSGEHPGNEIKVRLFSASLGF